MLRIKKKKIAIVLKIETGLFNYLISVVSTLQSDANQAGDKGQRT